MSALALPLAGVAERSRPRKARRLAATARQQPLGAASLLVIVAVMVMAAGAGAIAPHDPLEQNYGQLLQAPSLAYPFGTDELGRDVLSRIIYGARISLGVGVAAVLIGTVGGTLIGLVSGYAGGTLDLLVQRVVDAWLAFPFLIFAIAVVAAMGAGIPQTIVAIGLVSIPSTSRIVRASVMAEKPRAYIEAAAAAGASTWRILVLHILPNVAAPIFVVASLTLARAVLTEATLSYLGVGVPPPNPAWGSMLSGQTRTYMMAAPWLAIWPGIAISLTVMSWNLLGDALRDLWDPRLRLRAGVL